MSTTSVQRPGRARWWIARANRVVALFVLVGLATVVFSAGHPPRLSSAVRVVQALPGGRGLVVYGTIRGSFGPFRRGFGQAIERASLDLVAPDERFVTISRCIEEPRWQGILWPANWFRTEIWFSEVLPQVTGFANVRVRVRDRLGADRVSDPYPLSGGSGEPEAIPDDARWLALPGIAMGSKGSPITADDSTLEVPRR